PGRAGGLRDAGAFPERGGTGEGASAKVLDAFEGEECFAVAPGFLERGRALGDRDGADGGREVLDASVRGEEGDVAIRGGGGAFREGEHLRRAELREGGERATPGDDEIEEVRGE